MIARTDISEDERQRMDQQINDLMEIYIGDIEGVKDVETFLGQVFDYFNESDDLGREIHSIRYRQKKPDHLRRKLESKYLEAFETDNGFDITPENLFIKINDLAGVRLLHLRARQFENINETLSQIFRDEGLLVIEGPVAKTWDDEHRRYFEGISVDTEKSNTMYTSVHYVVGSTSEARVTCEIQVRTLAEEVWGQVSHDINYPHETESVSCREQIKALARATSTVTQLVDSIYATLEWDAGKENPDT